MIPCCCKLPSNHQLQRWLIVFFITLPLNRKASSFITKTCLSDTHWYSVPLIRTNSEGPRHVFQIKHIMAVPCRTRCSRMSCLLQSHPGLAVGGLPKQHCAWQHPLLQEVETPRAGRETSLAFKLTGTDPQPSPFHAVTSLVLPCPGFWSPNAGDCSIAAFCSPVFIVSLSKLVSRKCNFGSSPMEDVPAELPPALGHIPLLVVKWLLHISWTHTATGRCWHVFK